jgi:hypothetical protein
MKRIFLLNFILFSLFSCSTDNDLVDFYGEPLPIESVIVPQTFQFGEVFQIEVSYFRPTDCHVFNNFIINSDNENESTVILLNTVYSNPDCETFEANSNLVQATFNYQVNTSNTHVFKFWQGKNDNGSDLYLIVEVPVE